MQGPLRVGGSGATIAASPEDAGSHAPRTSIAGGRFPAALVAREISSKDRRARELRITRAGRDMLKRIAPAVTETQRILLSGLNAKEAAQFMKLMNKAIAALNDLSRAPQRAA